MTQPVLVVMAAGMGSRYGGLKQIDPVGSCGESILDFSLFDAYRAGFRKAVIIIKEAIRTEFMATVGQRLQHCPMEICYAFQEMDKLPLGFSAPTGRVKPFGTGHAILCARDAIGNAPFAVINADDYYGPTAFCNVFKALCRAHDCERYDFCMIGYYLRNTLSENGGVARGICSLDEHSCLTDLWECVGIERCGDHARYPISDGSWGRLELDTLVSMNIFGFTPIFLDELERGFEKFLTEQLPNDPLKAEYFLPSVVGALMKGSKARVRVLPTDDRWFGVTYAADKPLVVQSLAEKTAEGIYPKGLWK